MKRIAILVLFASAAFGQDAATVALEKKDLPAALKSSDALTRATAARVALVRDEKTLIAALREALTAEKDATAAREEMRALVLLGSDDDVAFAANEIKRFPISLDSDFGEAVARIGAPRATALYLKHVAGSRDPATSVRFALWGRASMASGTASRFLAAGNDAGWRQVLYAAQEASLALDNGVLVTGLNSTSPQIVTDTIWHLVALYAFDPTKLPEPLRGPATAPRENASTAEELGREVLRRMLGAKFVERPEFIAFLKTAPSHGIVPDTSQVRRYLTLGEQNAFDGDERQRLPAAPAGTRPSQTVSEPEFQLSVLLPAGLAEAILAKTKCTDSWIGVAKATVDRAGRVQSLDLGNVGVDGRCKEALTAMLELSLADPAKITSPLESANLVMVKPRGRVVCMAEDAPDDLVRRCCMLRVGGEVKPPKVKKRVEPVFPTDVRREMQSGSVTLTLETTITRSGCVRDVRLLTQTPWAELNASAILAVSEWRFEPATMDGVPVDVIFNLTVNYKLR